MNEKLYNKKLLLVLRILLFAIGFTIGFLAIYQFFHTYNEIVKSFGLKFVFYTASSLVPAVALTLSSKPIYLALRTLTIKVAKGAIYVKAVDIASVVLAVIIGILLGFATDALLSLFLNIVALKIFVDIIVGALCTYIAIIFCFKWLKETDKDSTNQKEAVSVGKIKGYLLTGEALKNERAEQLFTKSLIGSKFILDSTIDDLILNATDLSCQNALRIFQLLRDCDGIEVISVSQKNEGLNALNFLYSQKNHLKLALGTRSELERLLEGKDESELTITPLIIEEL